MNRAGELRKRSFLELPLSIDVDALKQDVLGIAPEAWRTPYWNAHGSSKMILLRGGNSGEEKDFWARTVHDSALLGELPYIRSLIESGGPLGEVRYAFLFKMRPMGVSRQHRDRHPAWKELFRVHVPVQTNPGAVLLSAGKAKHFAPGEVWTFHNQVTHSVLNGARPRIHLILDVVPTDALGGLIAQSRFDPGVERPDLWKRTEVPKVHGFSWPWEVTPLEEPARRALDLSAETFAGRIHGRKLRHLFRRDPLRKGDVIVSIDGVSAHPLARTPEDYLGLENRVGDEVRLEVLRDEERLMIPYLIRG